MEQVTVPYLNEVKAGIESAVKSFYATDQYLLDNGLNERTITCRFAYHLQHQFPDWNVDCEYNRLGEMPKMLDLPKDSVTWDDTEAKTVFPDIIIHKRGQAWPNLLVIEMKKRGLSADFDYQKLKAYQEQIGYKYSCFIEIEILQCPGKLNVIQLQ